MKDSLWRSAATEGVGFRDPRDGTGRALFDLDEPLLGPSRERWKHKLPKSGPTRAWRPAHFALYQTVSRPEHVIRSLKPSSTGACSRPTDIYDAQRSWSSHRPRSPNRRIGGAFTLRPARARARPWSVCDTFSATLLGGHRRRSVAQRTRTSRCGGSSNGTTMLGRRSLAYALGSLLQAPAWPADHARAQ